MRLDIIPLGILFTFDASNKTSSSRVSFYRQLYGYNDLSHGKYKYAHKGLLTSIPHIKPTHSTIITTMKDAPQLRSFFRKNKVKFSENCVMLQEAQAKKLKVVSPSAWKNFYQDLLGKEDLILGVDW